MKIKSLVFPSMKDMVFDRNFLFSLFFRFFVSVFSLTAFSHFRVDFGSLFPVIPTVPFSSVNPPAALHGLRGFYFYFPMPLLPSTSLIEHSVVIWLSSILIRPLPDACTIHTFLRKLFGPSFQIKKNVPARSTMSFFFWGCPRAASRK